MTDLFLILLAMVIAIVLIITLLRPGSGDPEAALAGRLDLLSRELERSERALRDELGRVREEMGQQGREGREELANSLRRFGESLLKRMTDIAAFQKSQLDTLAEQLKTLTQLNE